MSKAEDLNKIVDDDGQELIPSGIIDEQFCRAFVATLSPAKAAIAIGGEESEATMLGILKLKEPAIASRVAELFEEQAKKMDVQANQLIFELKSIAHSDIGELLTKEGMIRKDISKLRPHIRKAIKSLQIDEFIGKDGRVNKRRYKVVLWDKLKALQDLGRTIDLFNERDLQKLLPTAPEVEQDLLVAATKVSKLIELAKDRKDKAEAEKNSAEGLV